VAISAVLLRGWLPEGFKDALAHQETKGVAAFGFLLKSGIWRYLICKAMGLRMADIVDRKVSWLHTVRFVGKLSND
jgi:hypothetical protein